LKASASLAGKGLLAERPKAQGIALEWSAHLVEMSNQKDAYAVILFDKEQFRFRSVCPFFKGCT